MNIVKAFVFPIVAFLGITSLLAAQSTQPAQHPPDIIKLTLHAAAITPQSLQYKLLPPVTDQTQGDAAALYLLAARLGPDQKAAGDIVQEALDKYREMPLDQLAHGDLENVLSRFTTRMKYIDMAARREQAIFDFTLRQEGFSALLPYLNDMRTNANLLGLKARLQIARDDWEGAAQTFQTGFSMCQQLNDHAVLVQGLVETGMADLLLTRLREWGTKPNAPNMYWALSDLPQPFVNLRSISEWEQAMPYLSLPHLLHLKSQPLTSEEWRTLFSQMAQLRSQNKPEDSAATAWLVAAMYSRAKQGLISSGEPKEQVNSLTPDQVVGTYLFNQYQAAAAETWKGWQLPFWQYVSLAPTDLDESFDYWQQQKRENPLMIMLPSARRARFQFARLDREICISQIIEAVRDYAARHERKPPKSLDDVKNLPIPADPITGQPFPYRTDGNAAIIEPVITMQVNPEIFEITFTR